MLHEKYTLKMHSFVDLITNSSTEIYIEATEKTIESLQQLIDRILILGGSTLRCEDLFTIELNPKDIKYAEEYPSEYGYKNISLLVKCRDEKTELGKKAAEVLSHLNGLFHIKACYND